MLENQFFCVKCRKKVMCDKKDICLGKIKNKKRKSGYADVLKSKCKKCGVKLFRLVKKDDVPKLRKKYKKC